MELEGYVVLLTITYTGKQTQDLGYLLHKNPYRAQSFDLSFAGTICVALRDGTVTYVSRRYVSKIKQVLGI